MKIDLRTAILLFSAAVSGRAQWVNYPTPGIPRTRDGKPNLSAPAPRASNGKPDLSGLWRIEPTWSAEMIRLFGALLLDVPGDDPANTYSKYALNILSDFGPDDAPIRPGLTPRPRSTACLPGSFPFLHFLDAPFKVIQTPELITVLYEAGWHFRQIYTDGRNQPKDPQPLWFGYSVGKWEGETLVVESSGFNDQATLDAMGHARSEALRLTEHFHRRDFGHMDVAVTVDDPKIYTKPFSIKFTELLLPDSDVLEYVCEENEKDAQHI
jgi:hypothetical protein